MQAERHQIVHQVVAVRDIVKHRIDQALLLVEPNGPFAEVGLRGDVVHRFLQNVRRTIDRRNAAGQFAALG